MRRIGNGLFVGLVLSVLWAIGGLGDCLCRADEISEGARDDLYWRIRHVGLEVHGIRVDPLGSTLSLECEVRRSRHRSKAYIAGQIRGYRRQMLDERQPVMDVTDLLDGRYELELSAVEDGIVYQMQPTVLEFEIRREFWSVIECLVSLLKSGDTIQKNRAVRFLAARSEGYDEYLREVFAHDQYMISLLDKAVRQRGIALKREAAKDIRPVTRTDSNGMEAWDFSLDAASNPWWEKRTVEWDLHEMGVNRLYYDGRWLWFYQGTGVGRLDPETDEVRMYDPEDGLPTPVTGGIRRALAGDIYVGTGKHPARYDEDADRFVRILMDDQSKHSVAGMDVDNHGRLWTVSTKYGGGVSCYDGVRWRHSEAAHVSGITRNTDGEIWVGVGCEYEKKKWVGLSPGEVLLSGATLQQRKYSYVYADYLGRVLSSDRFSDIKTSAKWMTWADEGKVQEGEKVDGRMHYDFTNREFWVADGGMLVNDTRRNDPKLSDDNKWVIPWVRVKKSFNDICYVAADKVYLGSEQGLYKYDGRRWSLVRGPKTSGQPQVPDWARRRSRRCANWHDGALFTRLSDRKIKIVEPFPGDNAPRGVVYEIVKKGLGIYILVETLADGSVCEYPFKGPFRYEPDVLFADYHGRIWASGTHYVYLFDGEGMKTYTSKNTDHFDNDHIYSWAADKQGRVWIGTAGGLFLHQDGQFVAQPMKIPGTVFAMAYDSVRDELFVSSTSNGLDSKDANGAWARWRIPFQGHGWHDKMIRSIAIDREGTVWLATNAGLVSFSRTDNRWIKYGNGFTQSIYLMKDGVYVLSFPAFVLSKKEPPTSLPNQEP